MTTDHCEPTPAINLYRCPHCGKVVARESEKAWITSYCEEKGRPARIMKVKPSEQIPTHHTEMREMISLGYKPYP
jgi:ribosomal protein L37AE/L43A